jgi:hypothetical protein
MTDLLEKLMRFEAGDMDEAETIDFFQDLVNTGMAWRLQGYYGRMAAHLIDQGLVSDRPTVH